MRILISIAISFIITFFLTFSAPLQISALSDSSESIGAADALYDDGAYREALRIYKNLRSKNPELLRDAGFKMKMGISILPQSYLKKQS